ncbi:MAG: fibrillarin-like rRNA/tRNA 2'-O-methyltransferase [Thermoplasmata archaeon]
MKRAATFVPHGSSPRLFVRKEFHRQSLWTQALGEPPSTHGEPIHAVGRTIVRRWDPSRSKLAAGLLLGYDGPIPHVGETWLYLGAANGTTASHVADLVGPAGQVVAVERSPRTFVRLLALARRYPNLLPVLADARSPEEYGGLVPPADGIYADVAQPDQVAIVRANAHWFLRGDGAVLLALKTASMGRDRPEAEHATTAQEEMRRFVAVGTALRLDPFHRRHFLLGGRMTSVRTEGSRRPRRATRSRDGRPAGP